MSEDARASILAAMGFSHVTVRAFALSLVLAIGCDEDGHRHEAPTGSTCPDDTTLTWETFGRSFMTTYCTRCHSTRLSGAARNGAPSDHNFDSAALVREMLEHIDELAAAGPEGVNTSMPIGEPTPSDDERRLLGEWLACGAP